jgi:hypothetical protein
MILQRTQLGGAAPDQFKQGLSTAMGALNSPQQARAGRLFRVLLYQRGPPAPLLQGQFGPSENLTRLLTRMLGLGTGDAGLEYLGGGGNADDSHRLRMLDLGFPTALDPDRHAALAAEGVPAGRMVGAEVRCRQRVRLWYICVRLHVCW